MKLSVVIPARNEEGAITATVDSLFARLEEENIDHEIIVINDASTDNTGEILKNLCKTVPTLQTVDHGPPNGFGLAINSGLKIFSGDVVAIYMADSSDDPDDLVRFYRAIVEKDVECIFGSRFSTESKIVDYPRLKLLLNRIANVVIMVLFGIRYNDVTNAFKMYRREVIVGLQPILSHHFNITVELPLKAIVRGYTYHILPNNWYNRKLGVSKLKINEMGSRYLFIILYCLLEKWLSKGDYRRFSESKQKINATKSAG